MLQVQNIRECTKKGRESKADDSLLSKWTNLSTFLVDLKWFESCLRICPWRLSFAKKSTFLRDFGKKSLLEKPFKEE